MTITEGFPPVYFGFLPVMQSNFISASDSNSNSVMCFTINVPPHPEEKGRCSIFILEAIEAESHLLYYLQVVAFNSDSN